VRVLLDGETIRDVFGACVSSGVDIMPINGVVVRQFVGGQLLFISVISLLCVLRYVLACNMLIR